MLVSWHSKSIASAFPLPTDTKLATIRRCHLKRRLMCERGTTMPRRSGLWNRRRVQNSSCQERERHHIEVEGDHQQPRSRRGHLSSKVYKVRGV